MWLKSHSDTVLSKHERMLCNPTQSELLVLQIATHLLQANFQSVQFKLYIFLCVQIVVVRRTMKIREYRLETQVAITSIPPLSMQLSSRQFPVCPPALFTLGNMQFVDISSDSEILRHKGQRLKKTTQNRGKQLALLAPSWVRLPRSLLGRNFEKCPT